MVSLSILGMTGWVNPFCLAMRRPWTLSVLRRRSAGAFFVGTPALVRHPFWLVIQRKPLGLELSLSRLNHLALPWTIPNKRPCTT
jgi:hypothetical protein